MAKALGESTKTLIGAGFVLVFTIPMVRIFINSGVNGADLASMPVTTANFASGLVGDAFPMLSAAIGALVLHCWLQYGIEHDVQPVPV